MSKLSYGLAAAARASGQPGAPVTALAAAAAAAAAAASFQAGPPAYTLIEARTVLEAWREWKEGIAGGPAVEELERAWQARWRPENKARTAWCRRKVIISEVLRLINTGLTPEQAVAELEARRGCRSLAKLHSELLVAQKLRA